MRSRLLVLALLLAAAPARAQTALAEPPAASPSEPRAAVAVIGAMPIEVAMLRARLVEPRVRHVAGVEFLTGTLAGRSVVVAQVGVGKVNAAVTTTLLLEHFRPRRVVFTGVAGALDPALAPGDLVLGVYTAQHDLGALRSDGLTNWGARPAGDTTRNPVRFPGDTLLLRLARTAAAAGPARVREGTILTGDVFLANDAVRAELRRRFPDAVAVEMEGAAVAQVCWQLGRVPLLVVRSVSDGAGTGAAQSFDEFVRHAAERSSALVERLVAALPTP